MDRGIRDRYAKSSEPKISIPLWVKQSLVCAFIFLVFYGASHAEGGYAADVAVFAKNAVEKDITFEEFRTWALSMGDVANWDIRNFWSQEVTGKNKELAWPCIGTIQSYFGWRPTPEGLSLHQGIDIEATVGTEVHAILAGAVSSVRESPQYGLLIEVDHGSGLTSLYGHLDTASVREDEGIKRGQVIGTVGDCGDAYLPHLHFEIKKDGVEIDPMTLLPPLVKGP